MVKPDERPRPASPVLGLSGGPVRIMVSNHFVSMTIIKKMDNNKCWKGCGEIGTLIPSWREWKMRQSLWKTILGSFSES